MKKRCALLLLFLVTAISVRAQLGPGHHQMAGQVFSPNDGETRYYADFELNADGTLTGYTLTEWQSQTLKANLKGYCRDGVIFLQEFESNGTRHNDRATSYCYFAGTLRKAIMNGIVVFTGSYTSATADGSPGSCTPGLMTLKDNSTLADPPLRVLMPLRPPSQQAPGQTDDENDVNTDKSTDWNLDR